MHSLLFWNATVAEISLLSTKLTHLPGSRCKPSRMFLRRQYVMGTFSTSHHRANRGGSQRRPSPGEYSATAFVRTNTSTGRSRRLVDRKLRRGRDGVGLQWPCTPLRAPPNLVCVAYAPPPQQADEGDAAALLVIWLGVNVLEWLEIELCVLWGEEGLSSHYFDWATVGFI